MITCPWCGTNYVAFQPNCKNCGGQIPFSQPTPTATVMPNSTEDPALPAPPAPPRVISNSYLWRLITVDGWGIVGFVFTILGSIFTLLGIALTIAIITAIVGIPFMLFGLLFLAGGVASIYYSYQKAQKIVHVLREGVATKGQIIGLDQDYNVRVNGRNPWIISYQFSANGQAYQGRITTLNTPSARLQPGQITYVLFLQNAPEHNALYPHP